MTLSDVLPTLLDAIGADASIPGDIDGRSVWAALQGSPETPATPDYVTHGYAGMALYRAPWKLVDPESPRLYHVYDDPSEERDLAADHPEIVAALVAVADAWPRGPELDKTLFDIFLDPDSFGGPEDRQPWADVARDRVADPVGVSAGADCGRPPRRVSTGSGSGPCRTGGAVRPTGRPPHAAGS